MRLYALVEAGDPRATDVCYASKMPSGALADCLRDEPDWRGRLRVEEIELADTFQSPN
jgi:hypothetical protein